MIQNNFVSIFSLTIFPLLAAVCLLIPFPAYGQNIDLTTVSCDDCRELARDTLRQCGGPDVAKGIFKRACLDLAKKVRDSCDALCIKPRKRPQEVLCPAEYVQHWNKIIFTTSPNIFIELDNKGMVDSKRTLEVITQAEPNEVLFPFENVEEIMLKNAFHVIKYDEDGNILEERFDTILFSDIKILDVEYSTICVKEKPVIRVKPPDTEN